MSACRLKPETHSSAASFCAILDNLIARQRTDSRLFLSLGPQPMSGKPQWQAIIEMAIGGLAVRRAANTEAVRGATDPA